MSWLMRHLGWVTGGFAMIATGVIGGLMDAKGINFPGLLWWALATETFFSPYLLYFFLKERLAPVAVPSPDAIPALTDDVRSATLNVTAVSSKQLALWQSPTFIYYLMLNGAKSLLEYAKRIGAPLVQISSDLQEQQFFYNEGIAVMRQVASNEKIGPFFGLRLLIYPAFEYTVRRTYIQALISAHSLGRIHCIPIIKERLVSRLSDDDRELLTDFSRKIGQRPGLLSRLLFPITAFVPTRFKLQIPDFAILITRTWQPNEATDGRTYGGMKVSS